VTWSQGHGAVVAGALIVSRPRARSDSCIGCRAHGVGRGAGKDDAQALERCLRLLAAQTSWPLEVVVVDNGSRDASARIASGFGCAGDQPARTGSLRRPAPATTRPGDVIARCDADSIPPIDWVEHIVQAMADRPDWTA
jgi:cellulose synthase/poly-beta-1,6-N-acetylglucosamine synthase-like glycosyltransferase